MNSAFLIFDLVGGSAGLGKYTLVTTELHLGKLRPKAGSKQYSVARIDFLYAEAEWARGRLHRAAGSRQTVLLARAATRIILAYTYGVT
jgi:hypothetical protein